MIVIWRGSPRNSFMFSLMNLRACCWSNNPQLPCACSSSVLKKPAKYYYKHNVSSSTASNISDHRFKHIPSVQKIVFHHPRTNISLSNKCTLSNLLPERQLQTVRKTYFKFMETSNYLSWISANSKNNIRINECCKQPWTICPHVLSTALF